MTNLGLGLVLTSTVVSTNCYWLEAVNVMVPKLRWEIRLDIRSDMVSA